ncbi:hypothetical protein BGZ61DRAFT_32782 [Ilyonectria robusta]|uniref:uncharacterized protein n=1 Tax=Ilyonectria robusta TaxID=1079257 RepID=UPI001E8EDDC3|nr:uncharacterized protein BGZ61DRAFT_32782 [Ilyonectria robusta]KAH8694579.1 hypothetical protein BGZ61DRAFT_32782 [Ilyonectria robusta]
MRLFRLTHRLFVYAPLSATHLYPLRISIRPCTSIRSRPSVQPPALTTHVSLSVHQKRRPQNPLASRRKCNRGVY